MNKMNKKDMRLLVETAYLSWYTIRGFATSVIYVEITAIYKKAW